MADAVTVEEMGDSSERLRASAPPRIYMQAGGRERPLSLSGNFRRAPLLVSAHSTWRGLPLELHRMQEFDGNIVTGPRRGEQGLLVILDGAIEITSRDGASERVATLRAGAASVLSGDHARTCVRMRGAATAVALDLSREWVDRLQDDGDVRFRSFALGYDAHVLSLVRQMREEVARGASTGPLFAESLSLALLDYVVDRASARARRLRGQLSPAQRRRLESYVREHLGEPLSIATLSAQVGVSARCFVTLFRRAFGTSPHRYVLDQRIAEGARRLQDGERDLADIALSVGFSSQSHFTTAFRRATGTTPARFARPVL